MKSNISSKVEFIPIFKYRFLLPRYWGIWLALGMMIGLAYLPHRLRDPLLAKIGRFAGRFIKSARYRTQQNLLYCFPQFSDEQRNKLIDEMFVTAVQSIILMIEFNIRSPQQLSKRVCWHGLSILEEAKQAKKKVILMVPHGWSVDIPAMLLAAQGQMMAAMFHNQKNQLVDWLWNSARRRFGGRLHARNDGVKPFINSVRQGYWGYYLPDQDHGEEQSEFVDFFATYKATLPVIGRLMKICDATIIPLFPVYKADEGCLHIYINAPMDDIKGADNAKIARRMNEEVEKLITPNLEQYTWILKLLKTRKEGDRDPYPKRNK